MKRFLQRHVRKASAGVVAAVATLSIAATSITPSTVTMTVDFKVGASARAEDRIEKPVTLGEAGCIVARIDSWSASSITSTKAERLALIINGSGQAGYYARSDGIASPIAPLFASYAVDAAQIARNLRWTVSVVNFSGNGTASGKLVLDTPPTPMPCEFVALVGRVKGTARLRWRYTGRQAVQRFVAEQSEDGVSWRSIANCALAQSTAGNYECPLTALTSGRTYSFRVCAVTSKDAPVRCSDSRNVAAPVVQIKAP